MLIYSSFTSLALRLVWKFVAIIAFYLFILINSCEVWVSFDYSKNFGMILRRKTVLIVCFFGAEVLEKPKAQIAVLRELYSRLAEVLHECPGQYYRWCWFFGSTFFLKLLITKSQAHNHKRSSSYIFTTEINPAQNFTWRSNWTLKL